MCTACAVSAAVTAAAAAAVMSSVVVAAAPSPAAAASSGAVTAAVKPRHRHQEFLAFLKQVERTYRDVVDDDGEPVPLHLVMDNYAAHKHPTVKAWLAAHPRVVCHFTPTHASWMNLVEVWFGIIERQAIHRGTFPSVRDLMIKIRAFINGWNDRCHPFIWTKPADWHVGGQIDVGLDHAKRSSAIPSLERKRVNYS